VKPHPLLRAVVACLFAAGLFFPAAADAQLRVKRKKGPPVYCTTQYDPVCARSVAGVLTTFANDCAANAAGAAVILKGTCERVKCPPVELTVCAHKDGKNRNYTNACVAEKEGAVVLLRDKCPERCADGGPAVCGVDAGGKRAEFKSACEAALAGARVLHNGKCIGATACAQGGLRVCAIAPNGLETQYANECLAEAAHASFEHRGKCEPGVLMRLLQRYGG
jgi:hypothetical protein